MNTNKNEADDIQLTMNKVIPCDLDYYIPKLLNDVEDSHLTLSVVFVWHGYPLLFPPPAVHIIHTHTQWSM